MTCFSKDSFFNSVKLCDWRFTLPIIIISTILWLYSIVTASVNNISDFGLITSLPVTYFISISLLSLSFFISLFSSHNRKTLFLQIILLIIFLYLTPILIEGARQRFAYSSYGVSDYIIRTGFANPTVVSYNNWPSFQIFTAIFVLITGVDANFLIPLCSPFLMEILLLLPLYFFFKVVLNNDLKIRLALWTYYLVNWLYRDYLSSQTFGFVLFILIFVLLFLLINKNSRSHIFGSYRAILFTVIVLYIAVMTGHLLSAIILLSILFVLCATKYFDHKILFFSLATIAISWTVYAATVYLKSNLAQWLSEMFNFLLTVTSNINKMGAVNQIWERVLTNEVKMVYSVIFVVFAFIGLFIAYKRKSLNRVDKILLLSLIAIWLLFALPYSGEMFTRIWLFSLPFLVYFAVKNIDHRKIFAVFAIFLLLFAPTMLVWARYGEEKYDYIPQDELRGLKFLYSTVPSGFFIGGKPLINTQGYGRYHMQHFDFIENKDNFTSALAFTRSNLIAGGNTDPLYLIIDRGGREYHRRLYNEPVLFENFTTQLSNSTLFNKFYSNPDFAMYSSST